MPHPRMFTEDDPLLARVRDLALALPEAAEKVSHGRPAFFTQKVFAYFGGSEKRDGLWLRHDACVLVRPDPTEREALVEDERVFLPGYLHASGWIGFQLPSLRSGSGGWDEVDELLDSSYRMTAPARLVATLDARG